MNQLTLGYMMAHFGDVPILEFVLFLSITAMLITLVYLQFRRDKFDLRWLILDDATKKPSIYKIGQFFALMISSWGFVFQIEHDKLSDTYLTLYLSIWAGSTALNKVLDNKAAAIPGSSVTSTSITTATTTP